MEKIIEVVKAHPVPIVIGVVVLLVLMNRGNAAASSGSNAGAYLQAQSMATNANVQMAAMNSQASVALGAQSVDRYNVAEKAATDRMGIAASLFSTITGVNAQLAASNTDATVKTMTASMQHQENMQTIANKLTTDQATIAANVQQTGMKLSAAKDMMESDNNFRLAQIGAQTNGALSLLDKQQGFEMQTLPMALAHQEEMARITGQNAINLAMVNTQPANTQAQAAKNKSDWGIVTDIGSMIAGFFL